MFPSALLPALAGTLLFTVADDVPTLNSNPAVVRRQEWATA
jgi:hypothetical protein